jgi:enediyne biosynthesis protein E4
MASMHTTTLFKSANLLTPIKFYTLLFLFFFLASCNNNNKVFKQLSPGTTGINFQNKLTYTDSLTVLDFEYMFNGAGAALCDINNDGLQDILFTGNMVPARLYLNKGNLKFEDITEKSGLKAEGWCYGIAVVDINQDGYPDFYICKSGNKNTPASQRQNYFFINNGNNTFTESAAKMGLADDGYDVQAAFFDYDKDGDLDMYLMRNSFVNYNRNNAREIKPEMETSSTTDKLFRNDGNLQFTDVSKEAGITIEGFGLGVAVCDINKDNWPDLYVSNDFITSDLVWINNHDGTFTNKAKEYLRHQTYNAMGNDVADFNNDGNDDIVTVDMLPPDNKRWKLTIAGNRYDEFNNSVNLGYAPQYVRNTLQLNNGDGTFSEIAQVSGINATEWSWGPLFADFDNDGWKDLFVANGYKTDITNLDFMTYGKRALFMGTPEANRRERLKILQNYPGIYVSNYVFRNNHDLTFSNVSNDWGLDKPSYSNGAAYGDLDNDGDLDLVVNNIDAAAFVYENQTNKLNPTAKWMDVKFKGPAGNRDGLETKVWLWQNGMMQYGYCAPVRGYLSSVPAMVHFGLIDKPIDSIKVLWPDGKTQFVSKPSLNQILVLDYKNAASSATQQFGDIIKPSLLSKVDSSLQINYLHKEDDYIDFKAQPILQHTCSHEGPGLAAGDINGDGLDDFFIGAAAGFDGAFFIQQKSGKFLQQPLPHDNHADDMGALFFDADKDGDLDLYVVSGGTTAEKNGNAIYQDRLYMNDGKGKFSLSVNALPAMNNSGASVAAADYDKDGDLDLFVCGRVSPGEYPISPKSFLLRNDVVAPPPSGKEGLAEVKFTDVSAAQLPQQGNMGMVTTALWTDFDNDGWIDLVVAGEFMPITFIKNEKGKLINNSPLTIANSQGWWNSLVAGDFDNDGDIDYVAGNTGLNNWLKTSVAEPVCVYAKDYDKNGRIDPILCHYSDGVEYVVHSRDDINLQMTAMKARFKDYTTWAEVSFKNAFLKEEIADALVLKCQTFSSAYIENKGAGKFEIRALPVEAQLSPIYGMLCTDIDSDGNLDVVCVGNSYAPEVQAGRNDAQGMLILKGNGKGSFVADRTEFNTASDNKAISSIQSADGSRLLLVSSNSGSLKAYRVNQQTKQIPLTDADVYAVITNKNNKTYKEEFQFGNSYLSQSSRRLHVAAGTTSLMIYDNKGNKREVKL